VKRFSIASQLALKGILFAKVVPTFVTQMIQSVCPLWIDYGRSFISIADVRHNVR